MGNRYNVHVLRFWYTLPRNGQNQSKELHYRISLGQGSAFVDKPQQSVIKKKNGKVSFFFFMAWTNRLFLILCWMTGYSWQCLTKALFWCFHTPVYKYCWSGWRVQHIETVCSYYLLWGFNHLLAAMLWDAKDYILQCWCVKTALTGFGCCWNLRVCLNMWDSLDQVPWLAHILT